MLSPHITGGEGQLCDSAAEISDQFEYQMECLHGYEMLLRVSNSTEKSPAGAIHSPDQIH